MSVTLTIDRLDLLKKAMAALDDGAVVIGIPDNSEHNTRDDGAVETNSEIAFRNEFGEPSMNIPARPFLIPGVKKALPKCEKIMIKAAQDVLALNGDPLAAVNFGMEAVGLVSQQAVQAMIDDGLHPAPAPMTLVLRKEKGFMGEKPLLVTADLRRSIEYVVE